jgi:hypothetical protein
MDAFKFIPQLFFDLIARVVPGVVALVMFVMVIPSAWYELIKTAQVKPSFAAVSFVTMGAGYVVGHLIAPLGKLLLCRWTQKIKVPWGQYDWLRINRPDGGALAAKIRAEYTMHASLAAAFALALAILIVRRLFFHNLVPIWSILLVAVLGTSSLYRAKDTFETFVDGVANLYTAARPTAGSSAPQPDKTEIQNP